MSRFAKIAREKAFFHNASLLIPAYGFCLLGLKFTSNVKNSDYLFYKVFDFYQVL